MGNKAIRVYTRHSTTSPWSYRKTIYTRPSPGSYAGQYEAFFGLNSSWAAGKKYHVKLYSPGTAMLSSKTAYRTIQVN